MDPAFLTGAGAILSGGAALGSVFGGSGGESTDWALVDWNTKWQQENAKNAYKQQKEFARHGLGYQIDNLREKGLHPAPIIGQAPTYSPTGFSPSGGTTSKLPKDFRGMGQNISRALNAAASLSQREYNDLVAEGVRLDNATKRAKLRKIEENSTAGLNNQSQLPPSPHANQETDEMGVLSSGKTDKFTSPTVPTSLAIGNRSGVGPVNSFKIHESGYLMSLPVEDLTDLISEDLMTKVKYHGLQLMTAKDSVQARRGTNVARYRDMQELKFALDHRAGKNKHFLYDTGVHMWKLVSEKRYPKTNDPFLGGAFWTKTRSPHQEKEKRRKTRQIHNYR